jgi:hypothetical protein
MIGVTDFLHLPYTPDLSQGGITYACRSLAHTYDRMGGSPFDRLRRIEGGVAVELAFRRYLGEQGIPFDVLGATPFTDPDHYDLSLGGHRCDLKSYLITRPRQIDLLRRDPGQALQAPALLPVGQFAAEGHRSDDLYVFAFLLGQAAASLEAVEQARAAGRPVHLVHPFPAAWARPSLWVPLTPLALKSEWQEALEIEIGGQDAERNFITERLSLPPRTRTLAGGNFYSLAYVQTARRPEARLGFHSPRRGETYLVQPYDWGNVWIEGIEILLAGWTTHEHFRRQAVMLPRGSPTFQYDRTRTRNLALPVSELEPLAPLLERVHNWKQGQDSV